MTRLQWRVADLFHHLLKNGTSKAGEKKQDQLHRAFDFRSRSGGSCAQEEPSNSHPARGINVTGNASRE